MENSVTRPILNLYKGIKSRSEVRALIPMGYVAGMPIITVKNDELVAKVPFLRYKSTGQVDRTLVFPIKFVIEYIIPEGRIVGFKDLSLEPEFSECDFEGVIGFFRHEAVKEMDREKFLTFKDDILSQYDNLINFLLGVNEDYTNKDEQTFARNLKTIIEPFVARQYAMLDRDFYNKYLK